MIARKVITTTISIYFILLIVLIPFTAGVEGYSSIPAADDANDVYRFPGTTAGAPNDQFLGNFHPEIDIISVSIAGNDLIIEFAATPQTLGNYSYSLLITNNTDTLFEYSMSGSWDMSGSKFIFALIKTSTFYMWDSNSSSWLIGSYEFAYSINGNNLNLIDMVLAIPELSTTEFIFTAAYLGEIPVFFYIDYLPLEEIPTGQNTIPGFPLTVIITMLFISIGITYIIYRRKIQKI